MKIDVTQRAHDELKKILEKKNSEGKSLRLYIAGFGWGGPSFGLALDEQKENDEKVTVENLEFIVDKEVTNQYNDFRIDYANDWLRKGFSISANGSSGSC